MLNRLLEAKEKIKERGLKSPDMADALALTFAFPVNVQRINHIKNYLTEEEELDNLRRF